MNKPKPKILIIIGTLKVGGGAERVAATIGNGLLKKDYDVQLLTFYHDENIYNFDGQYYSLNQKLNGKRWRKIFGIPLRLWEISKYCRQNKIDITVSFLEEANFYSLLSKLIFRHKTKSIISTRNNPLQREWIFRLMIKLLQPKADKTVAVTRGIEEILKKDFGLKNTTTIYNPIDKENINKLAAEPLPEKYSWLKDQPEIFIHIGRHTKQKGQWHLLRSFQEVLKTKPKSILLMIGDGPDRKKIERFITDNKLEKNIYLIGEQTNVFPFIKISHCFVLSSLWEGLPNVVLEASALNIPIVSADCPTGPREILAPERPVTGDINWPYETSAGILTRPLDQTENYKNIDTAPLTEAEKELSQAMIKINKKVNETNDNLTKNFSLPEIVTRWEKVILELP